MQVRHNTTLLEQAIALVVERASIPIRQAEAEASAKRARAVAHRRFLTGAGIALAAVGIGLGIFLGFWKPGVLKPDTISRPVSPLADSRPAVPRAPDPRPVPLPVDPREPLINYDKFATQMVSLLGRNWEITAGHHFANETEKLWQFAWCYTNPSLDGVSLHIELAKRQSPSAKPFALVASRETLMKAGLDDRAALDLATKCPWLDKAVFRLDDFAIPSERQGARPDMAPSFALDGRVLTVRGAIQSDFLDELKSRDFDKLVIDSPGGLIAAAMEAGGWLRGAGKSVAVENECLSACVLVLAGGADRSAPAEARIGVHRFFSRAEDDHRNDMEFGQQMSSAVIKYLNRMGVDEQLFHEMAAVPSEDIRYIDHDTLRKWNLLGSVPGAPPPDPAQFIAKDGYDALGNDLPNMPIPSSDQQSCEARCKADTGCAAYTLNKKYSACFLKSAANILFNDPAAVTGYRVKGHEPRLSSMQMILEKALKGDWHDQGNMSYVECVTGCENDASCAGFTHDTKTKQCVLFKSISVQVSDPLSVSGVKARGP